MIGYTSLTWIRRWKDNAHAIRNAAATYEFGHVGKIVHVALSPISTLVLLIDEGLLGERLM